MLGWVAYVMRVNLLFSRKIFIKFLVQVKSGFFYAFYHFCEVQSSAIYVRRISPVFKIVLHWSWIGDISKAYVGAIFSQNKQFLYVCACDPTQLPSKCQTELSLPFTICLLDSFYNAFFFVPSAFWSPSVCFFFNFLDFKKSTESPFPRRGQPDTILCRIRRKIPEVLGFFLNWLVKKQ